MEVLTDNSNLKDSENQTSSSNYTCRLPRDLNIGSNSVARTKGENDVRLLVACKTQLSSEVIRWKTESLRLQKERDAARLRMKELDHVVTKFSDRTKELEHRLSVAEEDNKRLRNKIYCPPNVSALQKLTLSLNKYHSYPWSETASVPYSDQSSTEVKESSIPQEDWKDVSQKLLEKMKQEMKELQELGSNLSLSESSVDEKNFVEQEPSDVKVHENKLEDSLSGLITGTESLKHNLLQQRKSLKALINKLTLDNAHQFAGEMSKGSTRIKNLQTSADSSQSTKPKLHLNQLSKHSDDSVRAFFTKHLEGCQNIEKMSKTMQLFTQSDSTNTLQSNKSPQITNNSKSVHSQLEADKHTSDKKTVEDDRICPICQGFFDHSVPQDKFEQHVLDHLEEESASLLDQYVVV